jgi:D-aspartate ligase
MAPWKTLSYPILSASRLSTSMRRFRLLSLGVCKGADGLADTARIRRERCQMPRKDILPVLLGGDIGIYAIGRSFYEAYGVKSVCIAPQPIAAIADSSLFSITAIADGNDDDQVIAAVAKVVFDNPGRTLILMTNTDRQIFQLARIKADLPTGVIIPIPPQELIEQVSDKVEFARLCERFGAFTPHTEVVDLTGDAPIPPTTMPFPVVAKPAVSAQYQSMLSLGMKKVWYITSQGELDEVWCRLRDVGFSGTFVVQELIGGDDTQMYSVTAYVDRTGKVSMLASAHVLLEDHSPSMLGNPVAMVVQAYEEITNQATRFLEGTGYRGFANFDVKVDPKTGIALLFEVNPRIGRNSYYCTAGGANPAAAVVEDLVDGASHRIAIADSEVLYTLVPLGLLYRYLRDEDLLKQVKRLVSRGDMVNPQLAASDDGSIRRFKVWLTTMNQYRKFNRYYPKPTTTSF